jgi:hypothetical protein
MLAFDIDDRQLRAIAQEYAASDKQVSLAFSRALKRTAATLRRMASGGLKTELGLRNTTALRRRVKEFRLKGGPTSGVKLWFGVNDLPLSAFKGRARQTADGVRFGDTVIKGAFFARRGGKRAVYRRVGAQRHPIVEATLPVAERMMIYLEDQVFVDLDTIFFRHFAAEIRSRTIYGVGA